MGSVQQVARRQPPWVLQLVGIACLSLPGCFYALVLAVDRAFVATRGLEFTAVGLVGGVAGLAALLAAMVAVATTPIAVGLFLWSAVKSHAPRPARVVEVILVAVSAASAIHFLSWAA